MPRFLHGRKSLLFAAVFSLGLGLAAPAAGQEHSHNSSTAVAMKDLPLTPTQRQTYIGSYTGTSPDGEAMTFRIYEEDGVLKGQPEGQESKRLLYQGDHVFLPEGMPDLTVSFAVAADRATRFTARRPDQVIFEAVRTQ